MRVPPRNDLSACVVFYQGQYSEVMGFAKADALAMRYAAQGHPAHVYRLVEETMYAVAPTKETSRC